ncbi:Mpv17/PMP22 family protein [Coraliomargarita sp. SDUM461004]|uniref:Mpv17/PMP22 family protein n=1 Tax=Thalassobacterium sedimentorum TaxID=3041258 RepID=A0ABU1AQF9_9BACT|nr:Mpv17/PMP22 family protein [Coraliomargarita sp. SDUM461004]MDQ8195996.1 Mpv17/PMP22 family protein [Coraliomargarita sp. SDUM461004]
MHTTNIPFEAALNAPTENGTAYHRHFRSRNLIAEESPAASQASHSQSTNFDECVRLSIYKGATAIKRNSVPAMFTLSLMALLAWAYNSIPSVNSFFHQVSILKQTMGIAFPILAAGLSVGLISECYAYFSSSTRRWTMQNTLNFGFLFLTFGIMSAAKEPIFVLLANLYGAGNDTTVLVKKMLFDQFVWTVFLACPYQTLLFSWKNHGFSLQKMKLECPTFSEFFAVKMLPVLLSNWAFWIPMSVIIYSFPTNLQLPVSIIAISLWVCILNLLTKSEKA